ncbi:MAG: ATP-binding protein [Actinomycetota bacterium]|nr:ATP-binding protein [Actinomycetota bacterium]
MDPFECRFAPRPQTVPRARHALGRWLDEGRVGSEVRGDILLVASELMSNGVLHDGGDDLLLRAWQDESSIRLEVVSRAAEWGRPEPRSYDRGEFGRGLAIINQLAEHCVWSNGPRRVDNCRIRL